MAEILLGGKRLGDLKVTELKNELEKRGLQKKGVKSVLLNRLKNAILREALALDEGDGIDEGGDLEVSHTESTIDEMSRDVESGVGEQMEEMPAPSEEVEAAPQPVITSGQELLAELSDIPPVQLLDGGSEDMDMSDSDDEVLNPAPSCEDHEPIATTPTNEADQGHMSGAEEAPPILNPAPAVVPSPDDSAKEITEHERSTGGEEEDASCSQDEIKDTEDIFSKEDNSGGLAGRHDSVTIDPSYNPNGEEELLYEGDLDMEDLPPPSSSKPAGAKEKESSQDEGFIVSVHETGMELDMAESLSVPATDQSGGKTGKATASSSTSKSNSSSSSQSSKRQKPSSSPSKNVDRCSLWVSGLVSSVRALDLQTLFSPYGQVVSAKVVAKSRTKQLRFGFITMSTADEAQCCIRELNGTELKGKKITVELAKSQPPMNKQAAKDKSAGGVSGSREQSGGGGGSSSSSDRKQSGSTQKTVISLKGRNRDDSKSGGKSIADKVVERSRRSVELRKVTTSSERDRERDNRRKSAPIPRRSRSPPRGHRPPRPHSRSPPHISVHHRLGAAPSRSAGGHPPEVVRRELERDMYLRDRERQVEMRLQERRLEHSRHQEITLRRQLEAERTRREHDMARRMQEVRERENREREIRERQLAEQERAFKEKERELREREYRERQRREALERELREREAREHQMREREKRMKEIHEKELREREMRALKERELRERAEREARMQAERERELRERERRIKEEQERVERERRAHEEQQRWLREEAARVARVKEEQVRLEREREREREDAERRERERRQREEKEKRQEEELRSKREQQKREREELEKRIQSQTSSGRLGKRPPYQDTGAYDLKRPALSSDSYMNSSSSSIFHRLEPQKDHSTSSLQGGGGGSSAPLIQAKELPRVPPDVITAATQALENIRKSIPTVPPSMAGHLPTSRSTSSSLQAQIQQLAAATALANSAGRGGMDYRGGGGGGSGGGSSALGYQMLRGLGTGQGGGGGMMSKPPHGGGGGGGGMVMGGGKLPPEDQRYNRRLGGSGGRSGGGGGGGGGYRVGGNGPRQGGGYKKY